MSLHGGLDTVSILTVGVFSKTYHMASLKLRCNLLASWGYLEDAPNVSIPAYIKNKVLHYIRLRTG